MLEPLIVASGSFSIEVLGKKVSNGMLDLNALNQKLMLARRVFCAMVGAKNTILS